MTCYPDESLGLTAMEADARLHPEVYSTPGLLDRLSENALPLVIGGIALAIFIPLAMKIRSKRKRGRK